MISRLLWPVLSPKGGITALSTPTNRFSMTPLIVRLKPPKIIGSGAKIICRNGSVMAKTFEFKQAEKVRDVFEKFNVRYLFLGKSGAIILGYPDTTQDADVFVQKSKRNGEALVQALGSLGFTLSEEMKREIIRGKDFIQLRNGPFDLDLVFAPDGIESFDQAWSRRVMISGFPVCHLDDIIRSKEKSNRVKDRESLPRLKAFRDFWKQQKS